MVKGAVHERGYSHRCLSDRMGTSTCTCRAPLMHDAARPPGSCRVSALGVIRVYPPSWDLGFGIWEALKDAAPGPRNCSCHALWWSSPDRVEDTQEWRHALLPCLLCNRQVSSPPSTAMSSAKSSTSSIDSDSLEQPRFRNSP